MREHSRHIEGALRLGDADDAHRDAVARMQDDRHLIDRGAAQLVPQAFGDDDGNQALVGITALDPASREHAGAVDDRIRGVHALERDTVNHVTDLRQGIAAELPARAGLPSFDDLTTPAGKARPVADVRAFGQCAHGLAECVLLVGSLGGLRAGGRGGIGRIPIWAAARRTIRGGRGAFGGQAQGDGAPLVKLRQFARGLQEQVAQRNDDRHGGHSRDHAHEGEDDARLLDFDLAPGLDERAQDLTNGVHCSPSSSAPASSLPCPASARCVSEEGSSTSCSVPS